MPGVEVLEVPSCPMFLMQRVCAQSYTPQYLGPPAIAQWEVAPRVFASTAVTCRFQSVKQLKVRGIGTSFGEVAMLAQGECPVLLEGVSNLFDEKTCSQFTQYLHKHDFQRHL